MIEETFSFMVGTMEQRAWMQKGACRGVPSDVFYPDEDDPGNAARVHIARRVCNGDPELGRSPCPVKEECLEWALLHNEKLGVWGGCSERERRRIKRKRQKDARKARR